MSTIPSVRTSTQLASHLTAITNLETEISARIHSLSTIASPSPLSLAPRDTMLTISRQLDQLQRKVHELLVCAQEQESLASREAALSHHDHHQTQHTNLCALFKTAQMEAVLRNRDALAQQRSELLGPNQSAARKRNINQATQMHAARQISDGLSQIRQLMAHELEKSSQSLDTLENSSQTISKLENEHGSITSYTRMGRQLITKMSRRDFTDRLLILGGFVLFFVVVLYILKKRVGFSFSFFSAMTFGLD